MRRYLQIYAIMFRNSLIREMNFKANFLLWIVVELLWFLGQIVFIEVLFQYIDAIGDWTKWQVVLLVGTHQLIAQLFQAFFYLNIANLPELIRTGRLDTLLLLPMDAQFTVSTRQFGFDSVINALVSVAVIGLALGKLGAHPSAGQVTLFLGGVVLGIAVHYSVMFFLTTGAFWLVRAQGLIQGYYSIFNIGRYPDVIFHGAFRVVFSWVIPSILVANVPARMLLGLFESPLWPMLGQLIFATALVVTASRAFWKLALSRYTSASS